MRKNKGVFTVDEAATVARVSPATIRRLIAAGKLDAFRVGRSIRIDRSSLRATSAKGVSRAK